MTLVTASNSAKIVPLSPQLWTNWAPGFGKVPFPLLVNVFCWFLRSANEIRQRKSKTRRSWSKVGRVTTADVGCCAQGKRNTRL